MDAVHAGVEGCLLAHFAHLGVQLLLALLHNVLNAGGMDAAVLNEPFQRHFGHLAAQGAVGGKDDGFGRVVDDQVHAGGCLQSADIAALAADDAAFHVFAGQGHSGDGLLVHIIAGVALDDVAEDFFGLAVGGFVRFHFNLADHARRFVPGFSLNFLEQPVLGLFCRKAGYLGQALLLLVNAGLQKGFGFAKLAFLTGQVFFRSQQILLPGGGFFQFFFQAVAHFFQFALAGFDFAFPLFEFVFQLALLVEKVVLPLDENFFFLSLRLLAGFGHYPFGQLVGIAQAFGRGAPVQNDAQRNAAHGCRRQRKNQQWVHESSLSFIKTGPAAGRPGEHRQPTDAGSRSNGAPRGLLPGLDGRHTRREDGVAQKKRSGRSRNTSTPGKDCDSPERRVMLAVQKPGYPGRAPVCPSQASRSRRACTRGTVTAPFNNTCQVSTEA